MDRRKRLFWSTPNMEPWTAKEKDTSEAKFMDHLGNAKDEDYRD